MSAKDEKKKALDQDPIVKTSAATGIFIGALIGSATGTLIKASIDSTVGVVKHTVNQLHSCAKLASEISGNVAEITRNYKEASNKPDEQANIEAYENVVEKYKTITKYDNVIPWESRKDNGWTAWIWRQGQSMYGSYFGLKYVTSYFYSGTKDN